MAQVTSGRVNSGTLKHSYFYVNWQQASQSISGNSTTINWQAGLNTGGATSNYDYWYTNAVKIDSLWINGTNVCSGTYSNIGMDKGKDYQLASGSITIPHNTDGSKSFGITINGWLYSYGNTHGTNEFELTSIPRYANFTAHSISARTETSVTVNWDCDAKCDAIQYSLNGNSWVNASGYPTYTVSGLSANTNYTIKSRVRRKDSQLWTESGTLSFTTYNYPHCTSSPNFIIGNNLTLSFYNPLGRSVQIYMVGADGTTTGGDTITGTSLNGYNNDNWKNWWYSTIKNSKTGTYKVQVKYGSITMTRNNGNTYSIKGTEIPSFSNFTYKDTNTTVTGVTGNDQVLVKGLSNLQVTISSANKMVGNYSANPSKYIATIDTLNKSVNYSTSDINLAVGTVINNGTKRLTVTAYDSRSLSKAVSKDITVYDYTKPVINGTITRLNNFEAQTTLKVNGTYTRLTIGGTDKNTINIVQYKYREGNGTWTDWINLSTTVTSGKFTCNDVILSLDNTKSFEFQIRAIDKLETTVTARTVDIGQAVFFISSNKKACYINGNRILTENKVITNITNSLTNEEIPSGKAVFNRLLSKQPSFHYEGESIDLNTFTNSGVHVFNGATVTNKPTTNVDGVLLMINPTNDLSTVSGFAIQFYFDYSANTVYSRFRWWSNWKGWKQLG